MTMGGEGCMVVAMVLEVLLTELQMMLCKWAWLNGEIAEG